MSGLERGLTRVLVTGASGQIGTATVEYLAELGIEVTALARSGSFPEAADRIITDDARSTDAVAAALEGVDAVVHLAAIPHPSLGTPYEVFSTNVGATFNVLVQAAGRGIDRVVIASSINALGLPMNPHAVMPDYFPLDENLPTDIADPYSLSKRADELAARMVWRRWGMDTVALRFPLVKEPAVLGDVSEYFTDDPSRGVREGWSYLGVNDAARAIHCALVAPIHGTHVIGLSAPDTLVRRPTAELLAEYAPGTPVRTPIPGYSTAVDTTRARDLLGFEAEYSVHAEPAPTWRTA